MVSPTRKRDAVAVLQGSYRITTRRACALVGHRRSTQLYKSKGTRDAVALRMRMRELAAARPRYGYRRICTLLHREGWTDNIKRVYRLYRIEGLSVRSKPRKKRRAQARAVPAAATAPRQRWAIDFIHDTLADGRAFRVLSVVDVFSRSSEVLEPGIGFTGGRVAELLEKAAQGQLPEVITADNGTEFTSKALVSVRESWLDTGGPVRPLLVAIFSWCAEQERARLVERTKAGMEQARRRGARIGRPRARLDADELRRLRSKGLSVRQIADAMGCGSSTIQRRLGGASR